MKETILAMERYAEANNVPIIELDSIKFIMKYIKMNNVKSVLEIGTAIGYSAILMANATSEVEITTGAPFILAYAPGVGFICPPRCPTSGSIEIFESVATEFSFPIINSKLCSEY